jgi:hypothetical protein
MNKRPNYVTLNFSLQRRSTKFRTNPVGKEVDSCRAWFFTESCTGECLMDLALYILATKQVERRKSDEQPRYLTRLLAQEKVKCWLTEDCAGEISPSEAIKFHEERLAVATHAKNWGNRFTGDNRDSMRFFSDHVFEIAEQVIVIHEKILSQLRSARTRERTRKRGSLTRPAEKKHSQPLLF